MKKYKKTLGVETGENQSKDWGEVTQEKEKERFQSRP